MNLQQFLISALKHRHDEDFIDKLNNKLTSYILFAIGLSIFASEYSGDPMKCWAKPDWVSSWVAYAEDYCFIEGTFFVNMNETLPQPQDLLKNYKKVTFYQWVPFIFYLMGLLLQLPRFFWSFVNWSSYLHLTGFCNAAVENFRINAVTKRNDLSIFIHHFEDAIDRKCKKTKTHKKVKDAKGNVKKTVRLWNNHVSPRYLYISYMCLKIWNIINNVVIIFMLTILVADQIDAPFGVSIIKNLINGVDWRETAMFPRVTVCTFLVREIGDGHLTKLSRKTLQCVLVANMFIEKFFLVIWFWLIVLLVVNVWGLLLWILRSFNCRNDAFLRELVLGGVGYVEFLKHENEKNRKEAEKKLKAIENGEKVALHEKDIEAANDAIEAADVPADDEVEKTPEEHATEEAKEVKKNKNRMSEADKEKIRENEKADYLNCAKASSKDGNSYISKFRKQLGADGILTLYMIYSNAGSGVAAQVASLYFFDFIKDPKYKAKVDGHKNENDIMGDSKDYATTDTILTIA